MSPAFLCGRPGEQHPTLALRQGNAPKFAFYGFLLINCYIVRMMFFLIVLGLLFSASFADVPNVEAAKIDSSATFRVDEIRYDIGDAFDDSKSHTKYDRLAYDILNIVHIETREATVRKLLLFNEGDYVDLNLMLESERFLREQKFLSDASITVTEEDGRNVVLVHTSDNWTLSPVWNLSHPGDEWHYGIGIQESNFLGLGQKLGFYYGHDEFRDSYMLAYSDPHFLVRYNHFDVSYSYNTDGYLASWQMYIPYLSRGVNQWSYTLAGLKNQYRAKFYGSGDLPFGAERIVADSSRKLLNYNGKDAVDLIGVDDFISDSLSFRIGHSFGGTRRKFYLAATYDYRRLTAEDGEIIRRQFTYGKDDYMLSEDAVVSEWLPERKDSRVGAYIKYDNFRYEKIRNFHNAKWVEDIEKGYSLKAQVSKNYEQLGSADNDLRFDFWTDLYFGGGCNHLTLQSRMNFYLDHGERRDFYGRMNGEYIFHPSNSFATAISGVVDVYKDAKYGFQLTLGGADGFTGFPTGFYAGQARVYGSLEPRWFPDFEIFTLMPVFVAFASVGETAWELEDINRDDLIYVLGLGARFVQTKSISRLVNKIDVSFPVNGALKWEPKFSVTATYTL